MGFPGVVSALAKGWAASCRVIIQSLTRCYILRWQCWMRIVIDVSLSSVGRALLDFEEVILFWVVSDGHYLIT